MDVQPNVCFSRMVTRCVVNGRGNIVKGQAAFPVMLRFPNQDVTSLESVTEEIRRQGRLREEQVLLTRTFQRIEESDATVGKK